MEEFIMKKFYLLSIVLVAIVAILSGCNQDDGQNGANTGEGAVEGNKGDEEIIELAETFINRLSEGNYNEATENFDETMTEQLPREELEKLWTSLKEQFGDFIDQEYSSVEEVDGYQVVLLTGMFNDRDVTFQVTFDENRQIAGFYVQ